MMVTIMRDMCFIALALLLYDFFLHKGIIYLHEVIALLMIIVFYVFVIIKLAAMDGQKARVRLGYLRKRDNNEEAESSSSLGQQ